MGLQTWIMRRGAMGFTSSLLLLYTNAAATGLETEWKKWSYAFSLAPTLPVGLGQDDMAAFQHILSDKDYWKDEEPPSPLEIAEIIVLQKASTAVYGLLHPDFMVVLRDGVKKGIANFKAKFPNRAVFLEQSQMQTPQPRDDGIVKEWDELLELMHNDDERASLSIAIRDFFEKDNIDPKKATANYMLFEVGSKNMLEIYEATHKPGAWTPYVTKTAEEFAMPVHRPDGYPLWFLAVYPDAIGWLLFRPTGQNFNNVLTNIAGQISEMERNSEKTPMISKEDALSDKQGFLRVKYLRKIVDFYKEKNMMLECAKT